MNECICDYCNKKYKKSHKPVGKTDFCSHKCNKAFRRRTTREKTKGMTYFVNNCKKSAKNKNLPFDIDIEFLIDLIRKQEYKCAITGITMCHHVGVRRERIKNPFTSSLDRIDNSKGYTRDNVQFVCLGVNYLKNDFSDKQVKKILQAIKHS